MKTSELIGAALDWAVAQSEGLQPHTMGDAWWIRVTDPRDGSIEYCKLPQYSTDWAQGGPIIEREGIALLPPGLAEMPGFEGRGETLLIAAMRCYVASCLGDEVDVPEELK